MIIRSIEVEDIKKLRRIHERHYKEEFSFPDYSDNFHCVFTIVNDNGDIITTGGIRPIAEAITITDKDRPVKERREALIKLMQACQFTSAQFGYNQFHVFIQNEVYGKQLKRHGFYPSKGICLVKDI